jgi:hypothetical protein
VEDLGLDFVLAVRFEGREVYARRGVEARYVTRTLDDDGWRDVLIPEV